MDLHRVDGEEGRTAVVAIDLDSGAPGEGAEPVEDGGAQRGVNVSRHDGRARRPGGREAPPSGACESRTTPTRAAQASAPTEGTRLDGALPGFGPEPCFMRIVPLLDGVPDLAEPEPESWAWAQAAFRPAAARRRVLIRTPAAAPPRSNAPRAYGLPLPPPSVPAPAAAAQPKPASTAPTGWPEI